jgi:hypothetical protein
VCRRCSCQWFGGVLEQVEGARVEREAEVLAGQSSCNIHGGHVCASGNGLRWIAYLTVGVLDWALESGWCGGAHSVVPVDAQRKSSPVHV